MDDFAEWKEEWKKGDEARSLPDLASVKKSGRKIVWGMVLEVVASAGVAGFWIVTILSEPNVRTAFLGAGSILFVIIWLTYMFWNFRGLVRPGVEGARDFLKITHERLSAQIRWNNFAQVAGIGFGLFITVSVVFIGLTSDESVEEMMRMGGGTLGAYVILLVLFFVQRRRIRKLETERAELTQLSRDMDGSDVGKL